MHLQLCEVRTTLNPWKDGWKAPPKPLTTRNVEGRGGCTLLLRWLKSLARPQFFQP